MSPMGADLSLRCAARLQGSRNPQSPFGKTRVPGGISTLVCCKRGLRLAFRNAHRCINSDFLLGAAFGTIAGTLLLHFYPSLNITVLACAVVGMGKFFCAWVRAPLTGSF